MDPSSSTPIRPIAQQLATWEALKPGRAQSLLQRTVAIQPMPMVSMVPMVNTVPLVKTVPTVNMAPMVQMVAITQQMQAALEAMANRRNNTSLLLPTTVQHMACPMQLETKRLRHIAARTKRARS